jgi:hypothetical protein
VCSSDLDLRTKAYYGNRGSKLDKVLDRFKKGMPLGESETRLAG